MHVNRSPWLATSGWRVALVASGALLIAGGGLHPNADRSGSLREELATMTSHEHWVSGHALVVASTILLAVGLWLATRREANWPASSARALRIAAVAVSLYVVETVFHLAAAADADALRAGDAAPIAFAHIGLSIFLYPLSGLAIAALALSASDAAFGPRRWIAVIGVVAGVVHACAVPFTLLLPDTENTPLFAGASVGIAVWSIGTAVLGAPKSARVLPPVATERQAVSSTMSA
jgi:hypothetical protein